MSRRGRRSPFRALLRALLPSRDRDRLLSELDEFREAKRTRGSGGTLWHLWQMAAFVLQARALGTGNRGGSGFLLDFRTAARSLVRSPSVTVPAVVILGLTIGVNAAVYSVADGLLMAPLPYRDADRLVEVWQSGPDAPEGTSRRASPNALQSWREASRSLSDVGAWSFFRPTLLGVGDPRSVIAVSVTPAFLESLGVRPVVGRSLRPDDVDGPPVLLLSHAAWVTAFGSDPATVGRTLQLGGEAHEVVGVAPPGFRLPLDQEVFAWTPFAPAAGEHWFPDFPDYGVAGWTEPGADLEVVRAELDGLVPTPADSRFEGYGVRVARVASLYRPEDGGVLALFGAVTLVLVLGCLNTAQLLVARGVARVPELAVRRALGSGQGVLGRKLLLEAALLAAAGTLVGLGLAHVLLRVFVAVDPGHLPGWADVRITSRVVVYLTGVTVLASLVAGWLPARFAARVSPAAALAGGRTAARGGGEMRAQRMLLAGQAASAVVLLAGAGLLVRSWMAVQAVDPGVAPDGVAAAQVVLPFDRYNPGDGAAHVRFFQALTQQLEARPTVTGVTVATGLPGGQGLDFEQIFRDEARPDAADVRIATRTVGTRYFAALGVPLAAGRGFEPTDDADAEPVAVVNESAARLLFAGAPTTIPGQTLLEPREEGEPARYRVVGVARDVRNDGLDRPPPPRVYLPWVQSRPFGRMWVAVRSPGGADVALEEMRVALTAIDAELPLVNAAPLAELLDRTVAARRFNLLLLALLSGLAMAVALMGVSALVAFSVASRRREMGIRRALGAGRAVVVWAAVSPTLRALAAGAAVGLGGAAFLAGLVRSVLFGVQPLDGWSLGVAAAALLTAGVVAAILPAWWAVRREPAEVLILPCLLAVLLLAPSPLMAQDRPSVTDSLRPHVVVDEEVYALTGVRVVDGTGAPARDDQTVVVRGARIETVGPRATTPVPEGARVLVLEDHTLMPGLVQLHEHTYLGGAGAVVQMDLSAPLFLAFGVTTAMTAGSQRPDDELRLKEDVDAGRLPGPRLHVTGPYISGTPALPSFARAADPAEARSLVAEWAERGATWLKVHDGPGPILEAVIEAAHARGLRVSGHLCAVTFAEAAELDIDALQHGFITDSEHVPGRTPGRCPPGNQVAQADVDVASPAVQESIRRIAGAGAAVVSTLAVYETFVPARARLDPRAMEMLAPEARTAVERVHAGLDRARFTVPERLLRRMMEWERDFVAAGGLLGSGSDPWGTGLLPGYGNLRNYELLVEAGFAPEEAVRIMTFNGARIMGIDDWTGTVEAGKVADLVVIRGDPLTEPARVYDTVLVFLGGLGYDAELLRDLVRGRLAGS